jgi:glucosamine--fructose-6-phosphate aminotransferase (isomerizing)
MCGIFGIASRKQTSISKTEFKSLLEKLYLLSESRGKESAGLHIYLPEKAVAWTIKGARPASELIHSLEYKKVISTALDLAYDLGDDAPNQSIVAIAHSRLVTNGRAGLPQNNQPVRWGDVTVIHNGIIVNIDKLWQANAHLQRNAEVDTEILAALMNSAMNVRFDPILATKEAYSVIEGSASLAWVHSRGDSLVLASNTGDLYRATIAQDNCLVFASEHFILESALRGVDEPYVISQINPGNGLCLDLRESMAPKIFNLSETSDACLIAQRRYISSQQHDVSLGQISFVTPVIPKVNESLLRYNEQAMREIKRCSCCVLPETFPFIEFDDKGVCNYCRRYKPKYKDLDPGTARRNFIELIQKYRHADGSPDVLVPFSGGRDSCYGLHLIKQEFGLNPITFTYDWGMVTDLARRNIARFCGNLGVQNILVSADINKKRENIKKNVTGWLKKPDLGMVPLFMAGDKQFFSILNKLKKQTGIDLNIWSANPLENTDFKVGYCGVKPAFQKKLVDHLSFSSKLKLLTYYGLGFATNSKLVNSSLLDTGASFLSYYFEPRNDFISLFNHMVWEEDLVNDVIVNKYNFELATDSPSTWRIGDGTAPFYNYIYMMANGFSEFDTFRSNQIREGQITRDFALECIIQENRPRASGLRWYLDAIGLDFNEVIPVINKLDRVGLHR